MPQPAPQPAQQPQPSAAPSQSIPGQLTDAVEIPTAMVGKLIGRGGDTIKQLQYSSGTKIQIDHDSGGDTKRVTIASSSQQGIDKAKREIDMLCADDGADHTEEVQCPQGIVGRIIGRGGETIRALQQASQAHIVVDQNFPEGQPRKVIVTGRQDGVMRATKMIQELINGEPGSAQSIIQKVCAAQGMPVHVCMDPRWTPIWPMQLQLSRCM